MEIRTLISCTIMMLQLLLDQYESKRINYEIFESNTRLKIAFLKENIENIENPEESKTAEDILKRYSNVI